MLTFVGYPDFKGMLLVHRFVKEVALVLISVLDASSGDDAGAAAVEGMVVTAEHMYARNREALPAGGG